MCSALTWARGTVDGTELYIWAKNKAINTVRGCRTREPGNTLLTCSATPLEVSGAYLGRRGSERHGGRTVHLRARHRKKHGERVYDKRTESTVWHGGYSVGSVRCLPGPEGQWKARGPGRQDGAHTQDRRSRTSAWAPCGNSVAGAWCCTPRKMRDTWAFRSHAANIVYSMGETRGWLVRQDDLISSI